MKAYHSSLRYAAALGAAHSVADAITGFMVATLAMQSPAGIVATIVVYNIVAFALQPLAGLLVDRLRAHDRTVLLSLMTIGLGLVVCTLTATTGLFIIALGSAFFHASAGALSARATPGRAIGPSFFTAPGVIGLALGTAAGLWLLPMTPILLLLLTGCGIVLAILPKLARQEATSRQKLSSLLVLGVLLLGLGVALRSAVWTSVGTVQTSIEALIMLGAAAAIGKLLGGIVADRLGWTVTAAVATLLAGICFLLPTSFTLVLFGILLLQSSTPIILAALLNQFPSFQAAGSGLVQGLFLMLGSALAMLFTPQFFFGTPTNLVVLVISAGLFAVGLSFLRTKGAGE